MLNRLNVLKPWLSLEAGTVKGRTLRIFCHHQGYILGQRHANKEEGFQDMYCVSVEDETGPEGFLSLIKLLEVDDGVSTHLLWTHHMLARLGNMVLLWRRSLERRRR